MFLEKIGWDIEEERKQECNWNAEHNVRKDFEHTGWAKSRYTVIIFFFTGIVNDGSVKQLSITMLNNLT